MEFVSGKPVKEKYNLDVYIADYLDGNLKDGDKVDFKAHIYSLRIKKWGGFVIVRTNRTIFQCVADSVDVGCGLNNLKEECFVEISGTVVDNPTCKINPVF